MQHFLFRDKGGDFECVAAGYCFEFVSKSAAQIRMELAKVLGG